MDAMDIVIAGDEKNVFGFEVDRGREGFEPLFGFGIFRGGLSGTAEGDIAGNKNGFRGWSPGVSGFGKILSQLVEDEFLVITVARVAVTHLDIGKVDPTEEDFFRRGFGDVWISFSQRRVYRCGDFDCENQLGRIDASSRREDRDVRMREVLQGNLVFPEVECRLDGSAKSERFVKTGGELNGSGIVDGVIHAHDHVDMAQNGLGLFCRVAGIEHDAFHAADDPKHLGQRFVWNGRRVAGMIFHHDPGDSGAWG